VIIDWPRLRTAATAAADRAYAPYSGLRVGAAGLAADGQVITGCNVENASYGLTLCAECGLVSALHAVGAGALHAVGAGALHAVGARAVDAGDRPLLAVAVVAGDGQPLLPCGRCRQLLLEAGGPGLLVDTAEGPVTLSVLLPSAFTGTDLASRREAPDGSPAPESPAPESPAPESPAHGSTVKEAP
jgi:cytidine deaminase